MKQIFSTRFGKSLQKLEEASFLAEESFRNNNIDSGDFFPIIHLVNEIVSNTILFDNTLNSNSVFEIRIYLNSIITCIVESNSLFLESSEFELSDGKINSNFYQDKIDKVNIKRNENLSTLILKTKSINNFKTFYN